MAASLWKHRQSKLPEKLFVRFIRSASTNPPTGRGRMSFELVDDEAERRPPVVKVLKVRAQTILGVLGVDRLDVAHLTAQLQTIVQPEHQSAADCESEVIARQASAGS